MASFSVDIYSLILLLLIQSNVESCMDGDIRLAGGSSYLEGRVEICFAGVWGTVCDDEWDQNEASVVCRQLGFSASNAMSFDRARFGQGSGPIILHSLECTGNESNLFRCLTVNQCNHVEDAGVRCQNNDVALLYRGQLLLNNSLILEETLNTPDAISCVSTLPSCCNTVRAGNWFSPNSTVPLPSLAGSYSFHQSWTDDQTIQLHRSNVTGTIQEGLFHCDVPDAENTTHTFYMGIYSSPSALNITLMVYERSSHTVVCTSSGRPATSIVWSRDGVPLDIDGVTYQHSQIIVDTHDSIYENRLLLVNKSSVLSGLYGCRVTNSAGTAFNLMQLEVCRDNEVRLVIDDDRVTSALEVCVEDNWQRSIAYPFRILATEAAPRNVQVQPHIRGFSVTWELPTSNTADILSQEVTCSDRSGLNITMTIDQTAESITVPVTSSVSLLCCVTIISNSTINVGTVAAQTCTTSDLFPATFPATFPMSPNQVSHGTDQVSFPSTKTSCQTLLFVLGGIASVLFLILLVVIITLIRLRILYFKNKKRLDVEGTGKSTGSSSKHSSSKNSEIQNADYEVVDDFTHEINHSQNRDTTSEENVQFQTNVCCSAHF